MKVNAFESMIVNSPIRRFFQRRFEMPMLIRLGGLPKTKCVAEIGCGSGYGLRLILDSFKPKVLHGFDIDEKMLNRANLYLAKEIREQHVFLHKEDDNLSQLQKNKFSSMFFFGALHHIPKWREALKISCGSLESDGKIYLWEFYGRLTMNPFVCLFIKHPPEAAFSHEELREELEKNQLTILGEKKFLGLAGMFAVEKNKPTSL